MNTINLDYQAAKYAQEIVKSCGSDAETLISKVLGVLQEQGVYALMLFLLSRGAEKEKALADKIRLPLQNVLKKLPEFQSQEIQEINEGDAEKVLKFYSEKISSDLDILFLVRDLYEQVLIYARYGSKAVGKEEKK